MKLTALHNMKRIIFILAAVMAGNVAVAQLNYGGKAGVNVSTLMGVTEITSTYRNVPDPSLPLAGLLAGGYVRYDFRNVSWLGVQVEVDFSMQGARNVHYWAWGERHTIGTLRQNYITLPLLLHFKTFRRVPLSFFLGDQLGWCVRRRADGKKLEGAEVSIFNNDGNALVIGMQYAFSEHLAMELRLTNGSTPTVENDETAYAVSAHVDGAYVYRSYGAENFVMQLNACWTF
jgi:hypothetical protein